ncbi:transglycosylase SLT domain-containing protein [Erythrobacter sp. HKB08]|uniref:transglycosylase SLT domain-containing protein n=1 Tax=Erythrobacter sp. HKB08 TaxID=2502843 RepID=UPI0018F87033|nr:transglycosylase SLT domain-containing protein [Erythrobacter sp. HKB08]
MNSRLLIKLGIAALGGAVAAASPAAAQQSTADYFLQKAVSPNIPQVLTPSEREFYQQVFRAIDRENWTEVQQLLDSRPSGPLHQVAQAEFYLHANSPRVEAEQIRNWMSAGTYLPQTEQLVSLGAKRGLEARYDVPSAQSFVSQGYASKRILPRTIDDGSMPSSIRSSILEHIRNDDPDGARLLLDGIDAQLSSEARAEWRQRVAWSYYIENNDSAALAMAMTVAQGSGAWVAEGDWVAGLAAWRMGDCETAANYFQQSARGATNVELTAAAHYWASRALVRCREPEKAAEQLRGAARLDETLYGMLALEQLGRSVVDPDRSPDFSENDWRKLQNEPNVRTAIGLAQIGRDGLADEVLRHQARIGDASQYDELSRLARELGLPSTQLWMAHNAPRGARSVRELRYPTPRWTPVTGWKVDPALAYAHTLQESNFRAAVVSPAGARGLMQIMPAAARDHARKIGVSGSASDLSQPEINLAFGQEHLAMLRDSYATDGKLPKIMAAYNAGLTPVTRWNTEVRDQGDALLYMESIPYWETRGYVAIVMRNYWMYERQAGAQSPTRRALAEGKWPGFPEMSGRGVRLVQKD